MRSSDQLIFVTFHMGLSQNTRRQFEQLTNSFAVPENVEKWISVLFASARYFHPDCRCVLLSDETTPLQSRPGVEIVRGASVPEDPLWSRLNAERQFLRDLPAAEAEAHLLFLDFDIIINGALSALFTEALPDPWDVGVTYRVLGDMPINGGVCLVRGGQRDAAVRFFDDLLETYVTRFRTDAWWGEQLSLAAIAGEAGFRQEPGIVCRPGYRVGLLPGFLYNHTPNSASDTLRVPPEVKILHFKGKRKTFMADYWRWRKAASRLSPNAWVARTRILSRAAQWG